MEYLTTAEVAEKWKVSRRRVTVLCDTGRLEGAIQEGKIWLIPSTTKKLKIKDMSVQWDIDCFIFRYGVY